MTARHESQMTNPGTPGSARPGRGSRLRWLLTVGCVPLLLGALALVAAGIASPGLLVIAIGCTLMTGIMMTGRRPRHRRPRWSRPRNRRRPAPGAFTPASAGGLPQAPRGAFTPAPAGGLPPAPRGAFTPAPRGALTSPSRDGLTLVSRRSAVTPPPRDRQPQAAPSGAITPPPRDCLAPASPLARLGASADQTRAYRIIRERPGPEAGSPQPGEPRPAR